MTIPLAASMDGMRTLSLAILLLFSPVLALGQADQYPYVFRAFAGRVAPLGDGGPATQAFLWFPSAVAIDAAGNTFILDSNNRRIRKVDSAGLITTDIQLNRFCTDMILGRDGNFYLASPGLIFRVSPAGVVTPIAGTGFFGNNGGDGPAISVLVGNTSGIALDSADNVYFVDGARVRKVTVATGLVSTVAGTGTSGFNGDNQPATSANLSSPRGIAVDASGALFISELSRIRKVTNGQIQTIAGNGRFGRAGDSSSANEASLGQPERLLVDSAGVVYFTDPPYGFIMKITTVFGSLFGTINWVAGCPSSLSFTDGPAIGSCLNQPSGLALTASGDVVVAEWGTNRVRRISGGNIRTIAGRFRFDGDGGPATSAVFNTPNGIVLDLEGNVYIADASNYRIRKIDKSGIISTLIGNGSYAGPDFVAVGPASSLPFIRALAIDRLSNLYLASGNRVYKVTPAGRISPFAGTGAYSDTGDGGKAISATFRNISSVITDRDGNLFVFDYDSNRVRKISAVDGTVTAFAGSGAQGFSGDGGLATSATLRPDYSSALGIDAVGNVYIADAGNYRIRMVTPGGLISTIAGNGTNGIPSNGVQAKSSAFFSCSGIAANSNGALFFSSRNQTFILKLEPSGIISTISGGGSVPVSDGADAIATFGLRSVGIAVDASGDVYLPDVSNGPTYKLVQNSPTDVRVSGGNNQTGPVGATLSQALRVTVNGRAGKGVAGALVNFTVTSGSATLSVSNARTDVAGVAGIGLTPTSPGAIVVKATLAGSNLPAAEFALAGTAANPSCLLGPPSINSVRSAGDFGGMSSFASGSWLEIKGANLASNTRAWTGDDFQGSNAPTSLDGTRVDINGTPAFVYYISPGQLNVQAPADSQTGPAEIKLTNCAGSSPSAFLEKSSLAPGLLAPASFISGGRQYLVALHPDGTTYVGNPGLIAGVPFRPAKSGDSITIYGIGFGSVNPDIPPGVVANLANSIPGVTVSFGNALATLTFAGLAPGSIGLYQFNLTIPELPDGDHLVSVAVAGQRVPQILYLTIAR